MTQYEPVENMRDFKVMIVECFTLMEVCSQ